jgi:hypothetical protein
MKESYKDFVYFKMPIEKFEELLKIARDKGKHAKVLSVDDLLDFKYLYERDIESKQKSASNANRIKKAKKDIKIFQAIEDYYLGLFNDGQKKLTAYKLSKLAKINYRTAKRFWEEYNLDKWLNEFERRGAEALKEFKIQELAESFVWGR